MHPMYSDANTFIVISASPKPPLRAFGAHRNNLACAPDGFGITEIEGGFPHSEIRGSKLVRSSPRLIAAYHVLHRLSAPRHPPDTLIALDRSHYRCPSHIRPSAEAHTLVQHVLTNAPNRTRYKDQFCFEHIRGRRSGYVHCWLCSLRVK